MFGRKKDLTKDQPREGLVDRPAVDTRPTSMSDSDSDDPLSGFFAVKLFQLQLY